MLASNCFVFAAAVAVLLVHFDCHDAASRNGAFSSHALGAADVAAHVVGGDALCVELVGVE